MVKQAITVHYVKRSTNQLVRRIFHIQLHDGLIGESLLKNEEIYNIFDTARILDRPLGITVNDRSGLAGIAYWINTTRGLKGAGTDLVDLPWNRRRCLLALVRGDMLVSSQKSSVQEPNLGSRSRLESCSSDPVQS